MARRVSRAAWAAALAATVMLLGCGPVRPSVARVPVLQLAAPQAPRSGQGLLVPLPDPLLNAAVARDGQGVYQRTSVPPGFLVLMLGVPLLILLL